MSNDVTLSGKGIALAPLPAVSPEMRRILDTTASTNAFGGDAGEDGCPGPWREPKWLPEPLRAEAEKVLPPYEMWAAPATPTFMRDFLLLLFGATRHNADQDWDVVSQTYPMMLSGWPAWCFHPRFLPVTGQHFTWFPSVAELADWLRPRRLQIENDAYRLRFLSKLPTKRKAERDAEAAASEAAKREPWKPNSPEDKAKVAAICADLRAKLGKGDPEPGSAQVAQERMRDAKARRDPDWAAYLETSRRMNMAREQAEWEARARSGDTFDDAASAGRRVAEKMAGGQPLDDRERRRGTTGKQEPDVDWARFFVPLDQPLNGDLRAFYGHRCPGHEQPAVPSDEGEKSDMAPKSKARSFGVSAEPRAGESDGPFFPSPNAQEGA